MIVDIREHSEWKKDGITGSICIPERHISESLNALMSFKEVIFVCYSGINSRRLAQKYSDIITNISCKRIADYK